MYVITWQWFNPATNDWTPVLEMDYQNYLRSQREGYGLTTYFCFGNGRITFVDFYTMKTRCRSNFCPCLTKNCSVFDIRRSTDN